MLPILNYKLPIGDDDYYTQLKGVLSDYDLLLQLSYDIFDTNNDGKISQLDIFKILHSFDKGPYSEAFSEVLYKDVCSMTKKVA